jgi:hypothetical protein
MDSPQHCRDQSTECNRLMGLAHSDAQAQVLRNLASSWARLAGQIDRYNALVRDQSRSVSSGNRVASAFRSGPATNY